MTTPPTTKMIAVNKLDAIIAQSDNVQIIDVREFSEVNRECLETSLHTPLSSFDAHIDALNKNEAIYVLCQSGNRAKKAASHLENSGCTNIYIVDGGFQAWKSAGLAIKKGPSKIWSLERQVRFAAGGLVMLGVMLHFFVHPNWIYLSAGIAFGLMFSSLTNTCAMGTVLTKMPWNQA